MIKGLFKIIRPTNLLIMAITMVVLRYYLFEPAFAAEGVNLIATPLQFTFAVLSVLFAAAGGYAVNDMFDLPADIVNRPDSVVVEKHLKRKQVLALYILLLLLSIGCAVGSIHKNIMPLFVSVFFNFVLFLYSYKLKSLPFIGNVAISLVIAFVPAYSLLYEVPTTLFYNKQIGLERAEQIESALNGFVFFFMEMAFFINLCREVVKDVIDINGDKSLNIKTLPIIFGAKRAGYFCIALLVVMGSILVLHPVLKSSVEMYYYFLIGVAPCLLGSIWMLFREQYKSTSILLKLAMFIALMYLPVEYYFFGGYAFAG